MAASPCLFCGGLAPSRRPSRWAWSSSDWAVSSSKRVTGQGEKRAPGARLGGEVPGLLGPGQSTITEVITIGQHPQHRLIPILTNPHPRHLAMRHQKHLISRPPHLHNHIPGIKLLLNKPPRQRIQRPLIPKTPQQRQLTQLRRNNPNLRTHRRKTHPPIPHRIRQPPVHPINPTRSLNPRQHPQQPPRRDPLHLRRRLRRRRQITRRRRTQTQRRTLNLDTRLRRLRHDIHHHSSLLSNTRNHRPVRSPSPRDPGNEPARIGDDFVIRLGAPSRRSPGCRARRGRGRPRSSRR